MEELKAQIAKCPSGGLTWEEKDQLSEAESVNPNASIQVLPNGPLLLNGIISVTNKAGSIQTKNRPSAFCRCGGSANKPFCDGSHKKIDFKDE